MSVRRVALSLAFVLAVLFAQGARAFFDPPWITPENPIAGQTVSINIHGGRCDAIIGREGFPQITRAGNSIRIVEFGLHYEEGDELCIYGVGTLTRAVGELSAGDYTLTVDMLYPHPVFGPTILNIGIVSFTVAPPPAPASVPTTGGFAASLLFGALLVTTAWGLRKKHGVLLMLLSMVLPLGVRAQTQNLCVIPSGAPGAPTGAQIMAWVNSSPRSGPPPLQAFAVKAPLGSSWLIPDRATGDFLTWLDANPHSARKALEECQLATFLVADVPAALAALQADPNVASATLMPQYQLSSVELTNFEVVPEPEPLGGQVQYGLYDMNVDLAWHWAGGYALVGQIDMGLYTNGAAFRQFNGNTYAGGNFIPVASKDVGLTGQPAQSGFDPMNVDEKKPMYISDSACTATPALLPPAFLGHGTHAAGLLGANAASGLGIQGTCKNCGIAAWKAAYLGCSFLAATSTGVVVPIFNTDAANRAKAQTVDTGVQVLSMSFGISSASTVYDCLTAYRRYPMCLNVAYAASRDVAQVAASGNYRRELDFPASDKRVISAGGYEPGFDLWDDAPNCPAPPNSALCGSNYSKPLSNGTYRTRQELLGSAKRVLSTTYPSTSWAAYAECGDDFGTPMGDGVGWCTGTSMSAPQIAGVVGLLRSINPLVPTGSPEPAAGEKPGLRTVLKQTASRAGAAWDPKLGYGVPDAAAAARHVLGTAAGATVRNRATPLFRLYQATTKDFAETTSPQYALSLMINQDKNYVLRTSDFGAQPTAVPGYAFPWDPREPGEDVNTGIYEETPPAEPRAAIYVLTTEYRPRSEWPELGPLHLMDKDATGGKDYLLATTVAEIEAAHAAGYNLRTIQGYIYQPCTPEKSCIPPGAKKLFRQYNTTNFDCAVFLEAERSAFETAGYTAACPLGTPTAPAPKMIGYAYPATDADGDGLPDGFEYVIGTNPNAADSDGDGIPDATEFPLAGIATGDPCMGGSLGARNCGADRIFKNGFDAS